MKKLKLKLNDLKIESFEISSKTKTLGTVKGNLETMAPTYHCGIDCQATDPSVCTKYSPNSCIAVCD